MNSINFLYWLQGFFELSNSKKITKEQKDMILKHINIVSDKIPFISWLEGFLDGHSLSNKESVKLIQNKLNEHFENITKAQNLKTLETLLTQQSQQKILEPLTRMPWLPDLSPDIGKKLIC